jgi:hypothetical protein
MWHPIQNALFNRHRYHTHPEAVILACFFNPRRSPYRLLAFAHWYRRIRHLPHRIVECTIGKNRTPQLPASPCIRQVHAPGALWHKEALLNTLLDELPARYRYVFWLDTDILFTNQRWLTHGVAALQGQAALIQPFTFCVHLGPHQLVPDFTLGPVRRAQVLDLQRRHPQVWRSFAATVEDAPGQPTATHYDLHGHTGFAWGIRREILDEVRLYDKALAGGADHVIAHAALGEFDHPCLRLVYPEMPPDLLAWSQSLRWLVRGRVAAVHGDLYHLWHGALDKRRYLQRNAEMNARALRHQERFVRSEEGFWVDTMDDGYMDAYFADREVGPSASYEGYDAGFADVMGYPVDTQEVTAAEEVGLTGSTPPPPAAGVELTTFAPLVEVPEGMSERFS